MKNLFIAFTLMAFAAFPAVAQEGSNHINVGLDIGLPIGDFSEAYGLGIGVTAKGLYGIGSAGQITFTTGYTRFGYKDNGDGLKGSFGIIPLLGGYRHNFTGGFYVEPQLGLSINRTSIKYEGNDDFGFGTFGGSASTTSLGYGVGVGYMTGKLDASVRYQGFSLTGTSLSLIGFRVGYSVFSF